MRKLASIQKIVSVSPIEGADSIEVAQVLNWKCVIKKGEYKVGDKVVYIEIDSILPERPEFEFMRKHNFRVRTIKLRGQVSQGLVVPLSILGQDGDLPEGTDVTEILGIKKYEPPIPINSTDIKGVFPSVIPKTDEPRWQLITNLDVIKNAIGNERLYITEKLDGQSATFFRYKDSEGNWKEGWCSRNYELHMKENTPHWIINEKYKILEGIKKIGSNIAVQGELIGNKIQGNKYKVSGYDFYVYNMYDICCNKYLRWTILKGICQNFGWKWVPDLGSISFEELKDIMNNNTDAILGDGKSKIADVLMEGVVIKPDKYMTSQEYQEMTGQSRISFKYINPEFLLKYGE